MLNAIDHVVIAVTNLEAAAAAVETHLGLSPGGGGRHEAQGTHNVLFWLGDSYLELMGVFDASLARASWWGVHVLALLEHGEAGYAGLALRSDDLDADIAHLRERSSPISEPAPGERVRADGEIVRWRIGRLPQPDPELGLVFVIEHDTSAAEWRPADRAARASAVHPTGGAARLRGVALPVQAPGRTSLRLLRELGLQFRPSLAGGGARDTSLGGQVLRLEHVGAGSTPGITIAGAGSPAEARLLGLRWFLQRAT
jgi:catechol 2,3-dioxygenase-like lactoylglutathione lyase family enzyme